MEINDYILGIDFGTTYSCISVWKDGGLVIIPNGVGERTTPSVVIFDGPDKVFVGEETLYHSSKDNTLKIFEIKRILGKEYNSIKNMLNYFPYKIIKEENSNRPMIEMNFGKKVSKYYPEQIATLILKKLIYNAETFLNTKIRQVLITVPADFTESQKNAVRFSAEQIKDVKVLQVINEPSAAILAYGFPKQFIKNRMFPFNKYYSLAKQPNQIHPMEEISIENKNKELDRPIQQKNVNLEMANLIENDDDNNNDNIINEKDEDEDEELIPIKNDNDNSFFVHDKKEMKIIVFDLGGGTYDVSLIYVDKNKKFENKNYSGDQRLGGSDFDKKLVDYSLKVFCNQNRQNNYKEEKIRENYKTMQRLKRACERTKKYLSSKMEDDIYLENFYDSKPLYCKITRAKFEELCKDLFIRLEKPLDLILQKQKLKNTDIDEIILVGGSSKIPKVKEIITKKFKNVPINDRISPDEAVAYGASIYAESLRRIEGDFWKDFNYIDKTGHSLGIEIEDGTVEVIIPKGSRYPTSKFRFFQTVYDSQYTFDIKVYEGEGKYAYENEKIGEFSLEGIPKKPKGEVILKVTLRIEKNQSIKVTAFVNDDNNVKKDLTIQRHNQFPKIKNNDNLILGVNKLNNEEREIQSIIFEYAKNFANQRTDKEKYELIKKYNSAIIKYLNFFEKNYKDTSSEKYLYLLEKLFKSYTYFFNTSIKALVNLNEKIVIKGNIEMFLKKISVNAPFRIKLLLSEFKNVENDNFIERLDIFVFAMKLIYKKAQDNINKNDKSLKLFAKTLFEECIMISKTFIKEEDLSKMQYDLMKSYKEIMEDCDKKIKLIISTVSLFEIESLKSSGKLINKDLPKDDLNILSDNLESALKIINSIDHLNENKEALETKAFYLANIVKIEFLKKENNINLEHLENYAQESISILETFGNEYKKKDWYKEIVRLKESIDKMKNIPAPPVLNIDIDELEEQFSTLLNQGDEVLLRYILENFPYNGYKFSEETIEEYKKNKMDFLNNLRRRYGFNDFKNYFNTKKSNNDILSEVNDKIIEYIDRMIEKLENEE